VTSDGRYLVTNPEGTDLNPASANFEKAESYREGEQCELRNCKAEIFEDVDTLTPFCRIDLSKETDQVFVRSLAPTGRICLVVQGDDDVWSTTCKTIEAPKPELVVTANSVAISETKPVIELKFDYNYAMGRPKAPGCTELAGSSGPDKNGHGIYVAECPLNQIKTTVSVSLQGVGGGNVASRSFEVTLWKDVVPTLKLFGSAPSTGFGNFTLAYGVTRTYSVRDMESADLFGVIGSCPWVKRVKFKGILGEHVWHPVTVFSDVVGWKQANVEEGTWKLEDETKWSFTIEDFDLTYESANYVVSKPGSSNKFTIHALSETGDVDIISESDDCDGFATLEMDFQWSGKNVKNLIVEGSGGQTIHIDGAKSSLPNAPAGAEDDGVLRIVRDLGYMNSAWTKDMSFVVTAYFHDGGKTEPIPQTVTGFSCH
jgi:hypothetical protein